MNTGLTLSNLLNQTFKELGDNSAILGIFFAIIFPINALLEWVDGTDESELFNLGSGFSLGENFLALGAAAIGMGVLAIIVLIAMTYWFYAALMARSTSPGFARILPWIGIYILATLGIVFGLVLLIVPGVILIVRWVMVLPLVIEGRMPAMDTFGESWERTSGHSWSIFGTMVILVIVMSVLGAIVGGATGLLGGMGSIAHVGAVTIVDTLFSAVFIALAVAAYRLSNDDREELSEVFA